MARINPVIPVHIPRQLCKTGYLYLGLRMFYNITKTYLYNFDSLNHVLYSKLGFTEVYTFFLLSAKNIDCWYSLEPPRRGGSNEYPQSMFGVEI